jgi:hypothetical protein
MMRDLEEEKTEQIGIVEESLRNYTEWETRADEMRAKVATLKQEDAPRETQEQALEVKSTFQLLIGLSRASQGGKDPVPLD